MVNGKIIKNNFFYIDKKCYFCYIELTLKNEATFGKELFCRRKNIEFDLITEGPVKSFKVGLQAA
jgi:hypothetical protein